MKNNNSNTQNKSRENTSEVNPVNLCLSYSNTIKESFKDNEQQTSEDISNILAKQRQKEKGFKLE